MAGGALSHEPGEGLRLTAPTPRLDRAEVVTTAAAATASTVLYIRLGDPYLARGVVGDLASFAVLAGVLASSRRRARHEAVVCLSFIALVLAIRPDWPLRHRPPLWWAAVATGLGGYLVVRGRILTPRRPTP